MVPSDAKTVMEIETTSFPYPWKHADTFLIGKVGKTSVIRNSEQEVVGYLVLKEREAANCSLIVKMATHQRHRGKGIGTFILTLARELAGTHGAMRLFLRVRKSNAE